jgi:hypothetical protein
MDTAILDYIFTLLLLHLMDRREIRENSSSYPDILHPAR